MKKYLIILVSFCCLTLYANDFQDGNKAFVAENYQEAEEKYLEDISKRGYSFNTLYNLGKVNSLQNRKGKALFYHRKAQIIRPRDNKLKLDIETIEDSLNIEPYTGNLFISKLENRYLTGVLFLILAAGIFILSLKKVNVLKGFKPLYLLPVIILLLVSIAGNIYYFRENRKAVVLEKADILLSPYPGSKMVFTINEGSTVTTGKEFENFIQIKDNNERFGWLNQDNIGYIWKE